MCRRSIYLLIFLILCTFPVNAAETVLNCEFTGYNSKGYNNITGKGVFNSKATIAFDEATKEIRYNDRVIPSDSITEFSKDKIAFKVQHSEKVLVFDEYLLKQELIDDYRIFSASIDRYTGNIDIVMQFSMPQWKTEEEIKGSGTCLLKPATPKF